LPRATAYVRLLRPENDVMMGVIVIVGALVAGSGSLPASSSLLIGFLVGFALAASAMVLNDIADVNIDRLNDPSRPIPSGQVSLRSAWALFGLLSAAGLALAALQGVPELALAAISYAVAVSYDLRGKRTGLPGNMMVAFTGVSPVLYGALLSRGINLTVALEALMIFLAMVGREIAKGVADVEGDRANGIRTLAVVVGPRRAALASLGFFVAAVSLSPLPPALGLVNPVAYSVPVALADVGFLLSSISVVRDPSRPTALRAKELQLAMYAVALVGFALGALRYI